MTAGEVQPLAFLAESLGVTRPDPACETTRNAVG